jgi:hypothetical protein
MKPTRICNWPPRLDLILPPDLRHRVRPWRARRAVRGMHPALRGVAHARWPGRLALQRRFELAPRGPAQAPVR